MLVDWTLTVGNLIEIIVIVFGGLGFAYSLISRLTVVSIRLDVLGEEFKKLADVTLDIARIDQRLINLELLVNANNIENLNYRIKKSTTGLKR